jgi:hypothetical protein
MRGITIMRKSLLNIDQNPKTIKGQKYGFMTGVLYLAPANLSGRNVCSMAEKAACKNACLNSAGRGAFSNVQRARIAKTNYYFDDRAGFMANLAADIKLLVKKAAARGLVPLVRLNGTSDIKWENVPLTIAGVEYPNIMAAFPDIQFYDYTKIANRDNVPANYDLTFSYSGVPQYQQYVSKAIAKGMRVAVVFRTRDAIPKSFLGLDCVDGDDSDIRHIDAAGVIVALYAKGKARRDNSGFVVDMPRRVFSIQSI